MQEKKERRKHQHHRTSPRTGNPERARTQEDRKAEAEGNGPRPAGWGEDGRAWMNQLTPAKLKPVSQKAGTIIKSSRIGRTKFDLTRKPRDRTCRKRTNLIPSMSICFVAFACSPIKKFDCWVSHYWASVELPEEQDIAKWCNAAWLAVSLDGQFAKFSPSGFPQRGPSHHVGATMEVTQEKDGLFKWSVVELNP